ncbi:MAG: SDR family NAD(P)-dependent oxidoreductase [Acidimicrobiia bacterium]
MDARFTDKVVVITGGGAGIGRTYAHRFAEEGADIVIGEIDMDAAAKVVAEVEERGRNAIAVRMDVTDSEAVLAMAASAVEAFGGIDVLINNAGVHLDHAQLPYTVEAADAWRNVFDVNVVAAVVCSAACRPSMATRPGAAIINMSSMAAYGGGGAYAASKLAVNSLTVSLAGAFGADGIRVNAIAPGLVDSEAAVEWWSDPKRSGMENIDQMLIGGQVIKRQGRMHDLADAALFLCSSAASFITGQTLLVDGGYTKKAW